jgi:anti-sigma factor RsiW
VSTEHVQEEALHMHFDGELAPPEAASVQRHLATCGECGDRLASLQRLREMIVMSAEHAASEVDFEAMFGRVEQGTKAAPAPSWGERITLWVTESLQHNPMKVWAPVGGFAVAAAVLVFVLTRSGGVEETPELARKGVIEEAREPKREKMMIASNASEVVQVDFGSNTGTVFEIALADGASTPVVWINED